MHTQPSLMRHSVIAYSLSTLRMCRESVMLYTNVIAQLPHVKSQTCMRVLIEIHLSPRGSVIRVASVYKECSDNISYGGIKK